MMEITPQRKQCSFPVGTRGSLASPPPPSVLPAFLGSRAVLFISLAGAVASSACSPASRAGLPLSAACPLLRSQSQHPSQSQPRLQLQLHCSVPGGRETIAASSPASMVQPRAFRKENSQLEPIAVKDLLPFISKQSSSELSMDLSPVGTPLKQPMGKPTFIPKTEPWHLEI